jgi:hypothetical protein
MKTEQTTRAKSRLAPVTANGTDAQQEVVRMVELHRLSEKTVYIDIKGITPLIPHAWSAKARRMMPGHPDKPKISPKRAAHNPEQEAEECLYKLDDGRLGFPATAFKAAMVGAARFFDKNDITMTIAKQLFFVVGEGTTQLVPITGEKELHEDIGKVGMGSSNLLYRYYINNWSAQLTVSYVATSISAESIIALVDAGGRGGVGDWRPSSPKSMTGIYGQFRVSE